jgi:uncharacterized ion transporter superfamily protein YfcC
VSRFHFPHPLALLFGCVLIAVALSYILPAGEYNRKDDPVTGRRIVVPGTYHRIPPEPVKPFDAFVAIPRGLADAGSVVFLVFLVGGAFMVVDQTGALRRGVDWLVRRLDQREAIAIPVCAIAFGTAGALENMQEEIIALIPVLLVLSQRLGFDPLTAVAMSLGAAMVGSSFSPINPFQVGIAQKLASLPLLSGSLFRLAFLAPALGIWIWWTVRHARSIRSAKVAAVASETEAPFEPRQAIILILVILTFAVFIYGIMKLGWDFDQMSALFFLMGIVVGLIGGMGITGTADAYVEGFKSMAGAAMLIGFARAIYVVMDQGHIVDTIVHGLFSPLSNLPVALSAAGMMLSHVAIHFPVPSVSGQAVLTIPILVPLSDLLGMSRQVTVLAYQYGAGLCEIITPTNGALMAVLAAAGVRYENWMKFVLPLYLVLSVLGLIAILTAIAIGLH